VQPSKGFDVQVDPGGGLLPEDRRPALEDPFLPIGLFPAHQFRMTAEGLDDPGMKAPVQDGKDLEAQDVSLAKGLQVGRVLDVGNLPVVQVVQDLPPRGIQEGANDPVGVLGRHPAQARRAAAPDEPQEDFLGLVVGVVTQGDLGTPQVLS